VSGEEEEKKTHITKLDTLLLKFKIRAVSSQLFLLQSILTGSCNSTPVVYNRVYPKVSGLAASSENYK
jgi:hypothetical protein